MTTEHFDFNSMTFYETLQNGFYLPLVCGFIVALTISRVVFRYVAINFFLNGKKDKANTNFSDSLYYVLGISVGLAYGEYITYKESWRWVDYDECFKGYPNNMPIGEEVKLYYSYAVAFYIYGVITTLMDTKKKDFLAMLAHHLVTIALITLSASSNLHRIGMVIMLTFDICDIFLECAKLSHKSKMQQAATAFFVLFVAAWAKFRLFNYPLYVMPTIFNADSIAQNVIPYHIFFKVFIATIFVLQIYWSYFIYKKLVHIAKEGLAGNTDPREKDD